MRPALLALAAGLCIWSCSGAPAARTSDSPGSPTPGGPPARVLVVTHTEDVRDRLEHILRIEDAGDGTSRIEASG